MHYRYAMSLLARDLNQAAKAGAVGIVAYGPFGHSLATLAFAAAYYIVVRGAGFYIQVNVGPPEK